MNAETSSETIVVPRAVLVEIQAVAKQEHRPVADVLRDIVEQGLAERRHRQALAEMERKRARQLGISDVADDETITDEYRQSIREKIAQGLESLRAGRFTDGEAFMAKMDAELAELERQGR